MCESLARTVRAAHSKGFERFSFDYTESLALLTQIDPQMAFRWMVRGVDLDVLHNFAPERAEVVMVDP
jgi:hypothetical protein